MTPCNASVTPAVTPESRTDNGERLETRDERLEGVRTVAYATGAAAPRPRKRWAAEKRALLVEVTSAAKRHNQPHITEKAKDILLGAIGDLLNDGYPLGLIRTTALNLALDYDDLRGYSKLMHLRGRVRAAAVAAELEAHERRKREEAQTPLDPDTRAAVLALVRQKQAEMRRAPSTFRCSTCGWQRTDDACERCAYLAERGIA